MWGRIDLMSQSAIQVSEIEKYSPENVLEANKRTRWLWKLLDTFDTKKGFVQIDIT